MFVEIISAIGSLTTTGLGILAYKNNPKRINSISSISSDDSSYQNPSSASLGFGLVQIYNENAVYWVCNGIAYAYTASSQVAKDFGINFNYKIEFMDKAYFDSKFKVSPKTITSNSETVCTAKNLPIRYDLMRSAFTTYSRNVWVQNAITSYKDLIMYMLSPSWNRNVRKKVTDNFPVMTAEDVTDAQGEEITLYIINYIYEEAQPWVIGRGAQILTEKIKKDVIAEELKASGLVAVCMNDLAPDSGWFDKVWPWIEKAADYCIKNDCFGSSTDDGSGGE